MNGFAPNPFRPGAGQKPLYLAGRSREQDAFLRTLDQSPGLRNVIITGLRGVGKTVLLENLKPIAQSKGWLWTGNDLSESASLTEERISKRLITDLSLLVGPIIRKRSQTQPIGFAPQLETKAAPVTFDDLWGIYERTPGLTDDKLKAVLTTVRTMLAASKVSGIVFAYDEAQNLADHAADREYPLSILLDVFASLQRDPHQVRLILVLAGLPTLFPRLNEARAYTERMFDVLTLDKLSEVDSAAAIEKPLELSNSPLRFSEETISDIVKISGGYPYFLQYVCKEVFDAWIGRRDAGENDPRVARDEIISKLDQDFFSPRWDRATDRQQEFMYVISLLESSETEFTTHDIVNVSRRALSKGFSSSHATQILSALVERGLIYRNRHGKYSFAVPLMAAFIRRQYKLAGAGDG